ncbi:hypothetical protein HNQ56_003498 [Anaerotaenia torta]
MAEKRDRRNRSVAYRTDMSADQKDTVEIHGNIVTSVKAVLLQMTFPAMGT